MHLIISLFHITENVAPRKRDYLYSLDNSDDTLYGQRRRGGPLVVIQLNSCYIYIFLGDKRSLWPIHRKYATAESNYIYLTVLRFGIKG